MKKRVGLTMVLFSFCIGLHAQNKFKPLIERIALLQVYLGYLQKGYKVVNGGLRLWGDIRNGEFQLHGDYFRSLKTVNPVLRKSQLTASIITLQFSAIRQCHRIISQAVRHPLPAIEREAITGTGRKMLALLTAAVDDLTLLLSNDYYELNDDERLTMLDALYRKVADYHIFLQDYHNQWSVLERQRIIESNSLIKLRSLHQK